MGGRASVCLSVSVCLSGLKSWITFDGMKGSWWNFQDQSNSNSIQVLLRCGFQISWPHSPGPKWLVSRKSISSLSFCPTRVWHTFLETSVPLPEKNRKLNFLFILTNLMWYLSWMSTNLVFSTPFSITSLGVDSWLDSTELLPLDRGQQGELVVTVIAEAEKSPD